MDRQIRLFLIDFIAEIFQVVTWLVIRVTFLVFGKLTVTGLENIKDIKGSVILAPNHANDMDSIFLRAALPIHSQHTPIHFVTLPFKKYSSLDRSTFVKFFYKILPFSIIGAVPMVPGTGDYSIALASHIQYLCKGRSVCIFPEGIKTKDGSLGKPRGGVVYMAQASRRPIIPVTISGTFELSVKKFFTSRPSVTIHFAEPMYAGDIVPTTLPHSERYGKASEHIFEKIQSRLV